MINKITFEPLIPTHTGAYCHILTINDTRLLINCGYSSFHTPDILSRIQECDCILITSFDTNCVQGLHNILQTGYHKPVYMSLPVYEFISLNIGMNGVRSDMNDGRSGRVGGIVDDGMNDGRSDRVGGIVDDGMNDGRSDRVDNDGRRDGMNSTTMNNGSKYSTTMNNNKTTNNNNNDTTTNKTTTNKTTNNNNMTTNNNNKTTTNKTTITDYKNIIDIKYLQPFNINDIQVCAYNAGNSLGACLYKITINLENIYIGYNINHRKENHLEGVDLKKINDCYLFITNNSYVYKESISIKDRNTLLLNTINKWFDKKHKKMIIYVPYTRYHEIALVLNTIKDKRVISYDRTLDTFINKSRNMAEWSNVCLVEQNNVYTYSNISIYNYYTMIQEFDICLLVENDMTLVHKYNSELLQVLYVDEECTHTLVYEYTGEYETICSVQEECSSESSEEEVVHHWSDVHWEISGSGKEECDKVVGKEKCDGGSTITIGCVQKDDIHSTIDTSGCSHSTSGNTIDNTINGTSGCSHSTSGNTISGTIVTSGCSHSTSGNTIGSTKDMNSGTKDMNSDSVQEHTVKKMKVDWKDTPYEERAKYEGSNMNIHSNISNILPHTHTTQNILPNIPHGIRDMYNKMYGTVYTPVYTVAHTHHTYKKKDRMRNYDNYGEYIDKDKFIVKVQRKEVQKAQSHMVYKETRRIKQEDIPCKYKSSVFNLQGCSDYKSMKVILQNLECNVVLVNDHMSTFMYGNLLHKIKDIRICNRLLDLSSKSNISVVNVSSIYTNVSDKVLINDMVVSQFIGLKCNNRIEYIRHNNKITVCDLIDLRRRLSEVNLDIKKIDNKIVVQDVVSVVFDDAHIRLEGSECSVYYYIRDLLYNNVYTL